MKTKDYSFLIPAAKSRIWCVILYLNALSIRCVRSAWFSGVPGQVWVQCRIDLIFYILILYFIGKVVILKQLKAMHSMCICSLRNSPDWLAKRYILTMIFIGLNIKWNWKIHRYLSYQRFNLRRVNNIVIPYY